MLEIKSYHSLYHNDLGSNVFADVEDIKKSEIIQHDSNGVHSSSISEV